MRGASATCIDGVWRHFVEPAMASSLVVELVEHADLLPIWLRGICPAIIRTGERPSTRCSAGGRVQEARPGTATANADAAAGARVPVGHIGSDEPLGGDTGDRTRIGSSGMR